MRKLLLCLLTVWITPFAASQENSPPAPLTEPEKRQVLSQLFELKACREQVSVYVGATAADRQLDEKEQANYERALELERQATALAQRERDLEKDRATFYEQSYRALIKGPGIWCRVAKVLTLGITRCR